MLFMVLVGVTPSPATERLPGRDQGHGWQLGSSVVSSDEQPGEREGQPEAGPRMGGQRRQKGPAHLGECMGVQGGGPGRVG